MCAVRVILPLKIILGIFVTKLTQHSVVLFVSSACLLLGLSFFLGASPQAIAELATTWPITLLISTNLAQVVGGLFLLLAFLGLSLTLFPAFQSPLALLLLLVAVLALGTLSNESRWIASLGGFPVIGSGQGIIKYFALIGIACYLYQPARLTTRGLIWLNVLPVVLVLSWIGGMKFTLIEAQGIEPLIRHSFLMAWLYNMFDVQMTSNLIGVYDLLAASLLMLGVLYKPLRIPSLLMAAAVFIVTQTFLLTTPDVFSKETILTGTGQFLIKDLWFIANLLIVWQGYRKLQP
jgi:uncharacterized membrane protein YkgB